MKKVNVIYLVLILLLTTGVHANTDTNIQSTSFYQTILEQVRSTKNFDSRPGPSVFRVDYSSLDQTPAPLKKILGELIPQEKWTMPISLYFSLTNDLNFLRAVGVESDYDDFGYTHGSQLSLIGHLPNGHTLSFNYSTDLYTTPVNGEIGQMTDAGAAVDQYFTNENILSLIFDTQSKKRVFFWRGEIGLIELSSKYRKNFLSADYQQLLLHKFINETLEGDTKSPRNINNGKHDRHGIFLGIYAGISKTLIEDFHSCESTLNAEVGGRMGGISQTHFTKEKLALILSCQQKRIAQKIQFEIGLESIQHSKGQQQKPYFDFSVKKKKWRFGFRMEAPSGDLINYVDYNLPNINTHDNDFLYKIYMERQI